MRVYHNVCCGIDVHKKSVTACLMWGPADREPQFEIRRFGTMTSELKTLAEWLKRGNAKCRHGKHRNLLETGMERFGRRDRVDLGQCAARSKFVRRQYC